MNTLPDDILFFILSFCPLDRIIGFLHVIPDFGRFSPLRKLFETGCFYIFKIGYWNDLKDGYRRICGNGFQHLKALWETDRDICRAFSCGSREMRSIISYVPEADIYFKWYQYYTSHTDECPDINVSTTTSDIDSMSLLYIKLAKMGHWNILKRFNSVLMEQANDPKIATQFNDCSDAHMRCLYILDTNGYLQMVNQFRKSIAYGKCFVFRDKKTISKQELETFCTDLYNMFGRHNNDMQNPISHFIDGMIAYFIQYDQSRKGLNSVIYLSSTRNQFSGNNTKLETQNQILEMSFVAKNKMATNHFIKMNKGGNDVANQLKILLCNKSPQKIRLSDIDPNIPILELLYHVAKTGETDVVKTVLTFYVRSDSSLVNTISASIILMTLMEDCNMKMAGVFSEHIVGVINNLVDVIQKKFSRIRNIHEFLHTLPETIYINSIDNPIHKYSSTIIGCQNRHMGSIKTNKNLVKTRKGWYHVDCLCEVMTIIKTFDLLSIFI